MKIQLYTTSPRTSREYRVEAQRLQWFSHYGADGSGFGYAACVLRRKVGFDYADIGYGYRLTIRKGPFRCLFDGQITRITERNTQDGGEIELWALGWVHTATAEVLNRVYLDGRLSQWLSSETPSGSFQPQVFAIDTTGVLLLKPRVGATEDTDFIKADDYTYLRYTFPFGETAGRLTADYATGFDVGPPLKVQIYAGDTLLWEHAVTASGSLDLTATAAGGAYFEIRLVSLATGDVSTEIEDGNGAPLCYAAFYNVKVWSTNVTILDQKVIAEDMITLLSSSAHGLSAETTRLESPGFPLAQAAFESDQTVADILTWACQFGDAGGRPVAWGVTFDDTRRLFMESQAVSNIAYTVNVDDTTTLERAGDWGESAQVVYGVYTDADGYTQRTADYGSAAGVTAVGGYYRRQALNLGNIVSATLAHDLIGVWLNENALPKASGSYTVRRARYPDGRKVAGDELIPGRLLQVREFRALEVEARTNDYRDYVTTFMLAGVLVDAEQGTVELTPAASDGFQRQMTIIEHLLSR